MSIPDPDELANAAKVADKIVWGVMKSVMTLSVDQGLIDAGFSAAEVCEQ